MTVFNAGNSVLIGKSPWEEDEHTTFPDTISRQYGGNNNVSLNKGCIPLRFNESQPLPWEHPDNILSREVEADIKKFKDFTLVICSLIGGPANIINMMVYYKQGLQDRVNLCLFSLALFDDLFLISSLCLYSDNIYSHFRGQAVKMPGNLFMTNNNLTFLLSSGLISFCLSAIIACERCYCVLRPLKYQTLLSTRTMAGIIVSLSLSVFGLFFIVSFRYWVRCVYDPVTDEVMLKMTGGEFYRAHKTLIDVLDGIVFGAAVSGGIMIVVTLSTILTTVKLRQIVTWRTKTTSSLSAREVALTKMLIANSIFFIICCFPGSIFRVAYIAIPEIRGGGRYHNFYFATLNVVITFGLANSSFNFFIYFSMGSRYRETFRSLFNFKAREKKGQQ